MKHTEEMQEQAYSDALRETQGTMVILGSPADGTVLLSRLFFC